MRIYIPFIILLFGACQPKEIPFTDGGKVSHQVWDVMLRNFVSEEGLVNYLGWQNELPKVIEYTTHLSENPPSESWSDDQQLSYWINAYNAFTVQLILENYPISSIKALNPSLSIPKFRTIWTKEWFKIGGQPFSLDKIEHEILRKEFDEPRIHFALNCASISCPVLLNKAYEPEHLNQQLDEQAKKYINDPRQNVIKTGTIKLSKVFNWFIDDFRKEESLISFLNRYSITPISEKAVITFLPYDWRLNDQKTSNKEAL